MKRENWRVTEREKETRPIRCVLSVRGPAAVAVFAGEFNLLVKRGKSTSAGNVLSALWLGKKGRVVFSLLLLGGIGRSRGPIHHNRISEITLYALGFVAANQGSPLSAAFQQVGHDRLRLATRRPVIGVVDGIRPARAVVEKATGCLFQS